MLVVPNHAAELESLKCELADDELVIAASGSESCCRAAGYGICVANTGNKRYSRRGIGYEKGVSGSVIVGHGRSNTGFGA